MEKPSQQNEFAKNMQDWEEWQNHQYDPGYYTRGRTPPFFKGPRPNKFGYTLVVMGLLFIVAGVLPIVPGMQGGSVDLFSILTTVFLAGLGMLQLASGIRLLRR